MLLAFSALPGACLMGTWPPVRSAASSNVRASFSASDRCAQQSFRCTKGAPRFPHDEAILRALASRATSSSGRRKRRPVFSRGEASVHLRSRPYSARTGGVHLQATIANTGTSSSSTSSSLFAAPPSDPEAQKVIGAVREALARAIPSLPLGPHGRDDEGMIWWFLRDRKMDLEETVTKLTKAIRWRHDFGVANLQFDDVAAEAATGKAYLHEHPDQGGRPVIVVVAAKHFPDSKRTVTSEKLCVFLIEEALRGLPPGEEKFLGIFDLRGFNARNADLAFVGFLINVFFNYYPKRLHKVLFVDAPPIFLPAWRIMKPMLKSYASLVEFCSAADVREQHFQPGLEPPSFKT